MSAEIIVLFSGWWVVGGGWGPTFWSFKYLDNNLISIENKFLLRETETDFVS